MGVLEGIKQFGLPALSIEDFNRLAQKEGIVWKGDTDHDGHVDPNELEFSDRQIKKLYVQKRSFTEPFEKKYKDLVELRRREAVEASLAEAKEIVIEVDFSDVSPEEKEMVRHLLKVAEQIEALYHKQLGTHGAYYHLEGMRQYHPKSYALMTRNHGPECTSPKAAGDPFCNTMPDFPEPKIGIYPEDLNPDAEFCEDLTEKGKGDSRLTDPMTVLVRGATGLLEPRYYHEVYKKEMLRIALELEAAAKAIANVRDERALYEYLVAAAQSFRTGDWLESDRKWVALSMFNSKYAIRVGPDETYWDPCQNRAGFEMWFGRVNKDAVSATEVYAPHMQAMENELARLTPHLEPKAVGEIHVPDFVNIAFFAGDARYAIGGIKGQMLPNWSYKEVGSKQWIMNDSYFTSEEVQATWQAAATQLLHPDTLPYFDMIDSEPSNTNTVGHELAHSLGTQSGPQVVDPKTGEPRFKENGEPLTFRDVVGGRVASGHEELRAEVSNLHFCGWGTENGLFTEDQQRKKYTRQLMWALEKISHGMFDADGKPETYNQLAAVLLHRLLDHGAVEYKDGKFRIDFEKYPEVIEAFLAEIDDNQIHGDKAAIEFMYAETVDSEGQATIHADRIGEIYETIPYESYTFRSVGLEQNGRKTETGSNTTGCFSENDLPTESVVTTQTDRTERGEDSSASSLGCVQ